MTESTRKHGRHRAGRPWYVRMVSSPAKWWKRAGLVVAVLVLALVVDGLLILGRVQHVAVRLVPPASGTTFVIVGSDSRADIPAGTAQDSFGGTVEVPGERADVVLVVHTTADGRSTTLSVPRDLILRSATGGPIRLALTLDSGPQALTDALCRSLGIGIDHLAIIDFAGFAAVVDAVGGVTVDIPYPLRDKWSGLQLDTAGRQTLSGVQALALVRSRHGEQLIDGTWVADSEAAGAGERTRWAGVVFDALQQSARNARTNPLRLQQLAWTGAGVLTTDDGTGVWDLASLAGSTGSPVDLPSAPLKGAQLGQVITDATMATLEAAGISGGCTPPA
ncbi:transcriptional regulator [Nakamurella sp. YIM 132087]|uniref:Transcriptional regulator n=1 Tax=Nakamurella alba TaxID=2665158 RepID=A0A7K1FH07_9ACTN|nr:LCP family protein [Nakamurella alba]MTD13402.1 transcriptional regulator [Nakamurella alba]